MLDYARQRAIEILKSPASAVLVTSGPAGVQASEVVCQAEGLYIYLLLPRTSDHLFNLEQNPAALLVSQTWQVKGRAQAFQPPSGDANFPWLHSSQGQAESEWTVLVQIEPAQVQVRRPGGWGSQETLDLNPEE